MRELKELPCPITGAVQCLPSKRCQCCSVTSVTSSVTVSQASTIARLSIGLASAQLRFCTQVGKSLFETWGTVL